MSSSLQSVPMLAGLLTDLNIPSLTAPPKAGPFAINGVVESQKSEGTRCYSRYRWDLLNWSDNADTGVILFQFRPRLIASL